MSDRHYCYHPDVTVLRNIPGTLQIAERRFVAQCILEPVPAGDFNLAHLKAIHHHLFQDIYAWAGEVHTVEIIKDGSQFQLRRFIETGLADVHRRIVAAGYFREISTDEFAAGAGPVLGDPTMSTRSVKAMGAPNFNF